MILKMIEINLRKNVRSKIYDDNQLNYYHTMKTQLKIAISLKTQFENWYLAIPVLSFNGSKYDIN